MASSIETIKNQQFDLNSYKINEKDYSVNIKIDPFFSITLTEILVCKRYVSQLTELEIKKLTKDSGFEMDMNQFYNIIKSGFMNSSDIGIKIKTTLQKHTFSYGIFIALGITWTYSVINFPITKTFSIILKEYATDIDRRVDDIAYKIDDKFSTMIAELSTYIKNEHAKLEELVKNTNTTTQDLQTKYNELSLDVSNFLRSMDKLNKLTKKVNKIKEGVEKDNNDTCDSIYELKRRLDIFGKEHESLITKQFEINREIPNKIDELEMKISSLLSQLVRSDDSIKIVHEKACFAESKCNHLINIINDIKKYVDQLTEQIAQIDLKQYNNTEYDNPDNINQNIEGIKNQLCFYKKKYEELDEKITQISYRQDTDNDDFASVLIDLEKKVDKELIKTNNNNNNAELYLEEKLRLELGGQPSEIKINKSENYKKLASKLAKLKWKFTEELCRYEELDKTINEHGMKFEIALDGESKKLENKIKQIEEKQQIIDQTIPSNGLVNLTVLSDNVERKIKENPLFIFKLNKKLPNTKLFVQATFSTSMFPLTNKCYFSYGTEENKSKVICDVNVIYNNKCVFAPEYRFNCIGFIEEHGITGIQDLSFNCDINFAQMERDIYFTNLGDPDKIKINPSNTKTILRVEELI